MQNNPAAIPAAAASWLQHLRRQITGEHSRAAALWSRLRPYQKELIMQAAKLPPARARQDWRNLSHEEMRAVYRGINRLFVLKAMFEGCTPADFIPAHEWPALGLTPQDVTAPSTPNRSESLNQKAALLANLINH